MIPQLSVYRNLHKNCWSIQQRGRPVQHAEALLIEAPRFVVQPAGNARVRREKKKHVHAFVRSQEDRVHSLHPGMARSLKDSTALYDWVRVTYNPYKHVSFVIPDLADRPIIKAKEALLLANGQVFVEF